MGSNPIRSRGILRSERVTFQPGNVTGWGSEGVNCLASTADEAVSESGVPRVKMKATGS